MSYLSNTLVRADFKVGLRPEECSKPGAEAEHLARLWHRIKSILSGGKNDFERVERGCDRVEFRFHLNRVAKPLVEFLKL